MPIQRRVVPLDLVGIRGPFAVEYQPGNGLFEFVRVIDAPVQFGAGGFHRRVALQKPYSCPAPSVEDHFAAGKVPDDASQHRRTVSRAQVWRQPLGDNQDRLVCGNCVEQPRSQQLCR
nr:hypothetical protein [Mycobacterium sp.]